MPAYLLDATPFNSAGRPYGIGRYAYYLATALERLKPELLPDERLLAAVHVSGSGAVTDDLELDHHADPNPPAYKPYNKSRLTALPATLAASGAHLVHFMEGPQVLPLSGVRTVVTCHDLIPLIMPERYLNGFFAELRRRFQDYFAYSQANRVIAISKCTAELLVGYLGLPAERVNVVLQGVDHDRFRPGAAPSEHDAVRRRYGLPERYALYVGAADWRKRVGLLVESYGAVYRATRVPLVLAGAAFSLLPRRLREVIAQRQPGSIKVIGQLPPGDLPALYRQAELHVLPSIYEGFGLTVLEAMASGCPVVTTRGGALAEVGGNAVCYVACDSPSELEQALVMLLREPRERERLAALGLRQAEKFTWDRTARATLDVYRRACGIVATRPRKPRRQNTSKIAELHRGR